MSDQLLDQYLEERVYGPMRADGWPGFDTPEDELATRKEVEQSLGFTGYILHVEIVELSNAIYAAIPRPLLRIIKFVFRLK